jgi:hypothetical protein
MGKVEIGKAESRNEEEGVGVPTSVGSALCGFRTIQPPRRKGRGGVKLKLGKQKAEMKRGEALAARRRKKPQKSLIEANRKEEEI